MHAPGQSLALAERACSADTTNGSEKGRFSLESEGTLSIGCTNTTLRSSSPKAVYSGTVPNWDCDSTLISQTETFAADSEIPGSANADN